MAPPIDSVAGRREYRPVSTNPKIMDVMGTRPAGQGGPAPAGGAPAAAHRGQSHHRYQGADSKGVRAPFHPGNTAAFTHKRPGGKHPGSAHPA
jgi:hypothetical protein